MGTTAVGWHLDGHNDGIIVSVSGENTNVFDSGHSVSYPTLSKSAGVLLYDRRSNTNEFGADLVYRTLRGDGSPSSSSFLLPGVQRSSLTSNLDPAFTADGRYIVYREQVTTQSGGVFHAGNVHLFVYDTSTGSLLNPGGLDLGYGDLAEFQRSEGSLSVYEKLTLKSTSFLNTSAGPIVAFTLNDPSGVGILVERIVGHHRLFGRRVPTLRKVGKVPFGHFRRGKHRVGWNLRVRGKKLRPGRYLVIPRAVTRKGIIRELGKPHSMRVR